MASRRRSRGKPDTSIGEDSSPENMSPSQSPSKPGPSKRRSKGAPESNDEEPSISPPKKSKKDPPKSVEKKSRTPKGKSAQPEETNEAEENEERRGNFEEDDTHSDEEGGIRIGDIYIPPPPPATTGVDLSGPRLIITHIENENFKSYAGKTVLGPFHKCFTSIVGPNGSGKSNVIDSMLFVFGYRASKIRSKKISVLLHNSDEHKNVTSCTVAVHFKLIIDKVSIQS